MAIILKEDFTNAVEPSEIGGAKIANAILEIPDIFAILVPAHIIFQALLLWVNGYFHAVIEKRIWLWVVEDVEADFVIGTRIFDLVKEPLRMSLSVDVIWHQQVVFNVWNLLRKVKIAAFKSRLK